MNLLTSIGLVAVSIPAFSGGQDIPPSTVIIPEAGIVAPTSPEAEALLIDLRKRDRLADIEAAMSI